MSDLHLEMRHPYTAFDFPVTAPFLILAGDIGRLGEHDEYVAFLERQAGRYRRVFLVLGNHEFYGMEHRAGIEKAQDMMHDPRLQRKTTLLHRHRYDMPDDSGVSILGCTLWSHVSPACSSEVSRALTDFQAPGIHRWTVETHNEAHAADVLWLRRQVGDMQQDRDQPPRSVVVVTHHAPLVAGSAHPLHGGSPRQAAFSTDVCTSGDWSPVRHWVFGHTHWTADLTVNGIRAMANQRGYVYPSHVRARSETLPPEHTFDAARTIDV